MDMLEVEGGLSRLQLRFTNFKSRQRGRAAYAFEDNQILKLGAAIAVYSGRETEPQEIFRGLVTGIEGEYSDRPPELIVHAEDAFQRARLARRTKTHAPLTIHDLAEQVARNCSLTPVIDGFTDQIGPQVQLNESDLAFLRRLLSRYGGDMQVVGEEMHVSARSAVQRGTVDLEMHEDLRRVGTHVNVAGLGDRFDNTYYVVEARHRYGVPTPGYVTDFRAECAYWGV